MSTKLEGMTDNMSTADTFTGKKVIDREGIQYGKVKHIHINQDTLTVSGVTIHQGFNKDIFFQKTILTNSLKKHCFLADLLLELESL